MADRSRPPLGEVVRNPRRDGTYTYALRFSAAGKRYYVTLGRPEDGWTDKRATDELANVLADVRRGIWQPPSKTPTIVEPPDDPTFHEFASAWFDAASKELRPNTVLDYEWQLRVHLLPFFKDHRLSQITVAEVDRYREAKVAEDALSAVSINKTLTRLGQILELAVERELIARNPAKVGGKRRRLKAARPARTYLDRAEQITALLDAAGELDLEARSNGRMARRALLSTLVFAGLRITEALDLEWRDVDLAAGRLRVRASKTDAGVRYVDLLPILWQELRQHRAASAQGLVFPSAAGTRQDRNRVRTRILAKAVKRANTKLAGEGFTPLPDGLTLHALRRTCASLRIALGHDPRQVMGAMGHTDPSVTLGIYAQVMMFGDAEREALRQLVDGAYLAVAGSSGENDGGSVPVEVQTAA
jgi:integrase